MCKIVVSDVYAETFINIFLLLTLGYIFLFFFLKSRAEKYRSHMVGIVYERQLAFQQ